MAYLTIIIVYSAAQMALGIWVARRVRRSADFFVAGRTLGPGLLFATLLAANIGGGSTIGATGLGYRYGMAAWWWVGSTSIGSIILALWVGPRIRRIAAAHDLRTVGDFLEWRFDRRVRATIASLLWVATLAILAGQFIGLAFVLDALVGIPKPLGCLIGGIVVATYFSAGGLLSSATVNVVQVIVKLVGFAIALPLALHAAGGLTGLRGQVPDPAMWNLWSNGPSGWVYVAMLTPAFIVSPGILQKVYGARNDAAVRIGVGLNAVALLAFAAVPPLLGLVAQVLHPGLENRELALPMVLIHDVPFWVGGLGLAAVFSAEVSAADAILFMLATSLSQDLYKRFLNPSATDQEVLRVARRASLAGGTLGVLLAIASESITDSLSIFYTLLSVSLFVPLMAGLYLRRSGPLEALAAIAGGVAAVVATQLWGGGKPVGGFTPAMCGLICAALAFGLVSLTAHSGSPRERV